MRPARLGLLLVLVVALGGQGIARAEAPAEHYDVIIVGGGPGGLVAARRLAMLGRKVLVVEKRSRERTRTQIVGTRQLSQDLLEQVGVTFDARARARLVGQRSAQARLPSATPPSAEDDPVAHMAASPVAHAISIKALEAQLYAPVGDQLTVLDRSEPTGPPTVDAEGRVTLQLGGSGARTVTGKYLVVSDGAGSPMLRSLAVGTETFATGKLAAAFWKQKGRNIAVKGHGVVRMADEHTTYTLTALKPEEEHLTGAALDRVLSRRGSKVGVKHGTPYRVWTFDTKMQRADSIRPLEGKALVIGDAASAPHPFTALGVNKAIVDGYGAAEAVHAMLGARDEQTRQEIGARWQEKAERAIVSLHKAALPFYRQFGRILKEPTHVTGRR